MKAPEQAELVEIESSRLVLLHSVHRDVSTSTLRIALTLGAFFLVRCGDVEGDDPAPGTGGTSGGTVGSGGTSAGSGATGGAAGSFTTGGTNANGGTTSTGGALGTGGSGVGGSAGSATGGSSATGGTATGGEATGGTASGTGGAGQGGTTSGGAGQGGTAQGGVGAQGGKGGAGQGGTGQGGKAAGGSANGGSAQGGKGGTGAGGGGSTGMYACNGTTTGYNATMIKSGSTWTVTNGTPRYTGSDMEAALRAAYASLTSGRTTKQSILVQGSGDIPATSQIVIPSYTILNVCGTINVTGTPSGSDRSPIRSTNARDIEIPNLKMTGSPQYGLFFRGTNNVHLGQIDLRLTRSAGIGIRADTSGNAGSDSNFNTNLRIDYVYGSGMGSHIVETYGINGIVIGKAEGNDVGECGVLLNRSINATIDLVTCTGCATGVGYAAFRMANNNGVINGNTSTVNIVAKSVIARGGGRGVFSVSGSGAARIDHVDLQDTGNNSILLENAHNVTVGNTSTQSRIANSGQLRIAGTSSDIRIQNIAVSGTTISESPCATNSTWTNVNGAPTNCN